MFHFRKRVQCVPVQEQEVLPRRLSQTDISSFRIRWKYTIKVVLNTLLSVNLLRNKITFTCKHDKDTCNTKQRCLTPCIDDYRKLQGIHPPQHIQAQRETLLVNIQWYILPVTAHVTRSMCVSKTQSTLFPLWMVLWKWKMCQAWKMA